MPYGVMMTERPDPHRHRHHRPNPNYIPPPSPESLIGDMMRVAAAMMGPQFAEDGQQRWHAVEDGISYSGLAVTDGGENYFIYGKSTIVPHSAKAAVWGLKRVIFDKNNPGRKLSVSTQAYRQPQDEFKPSDFPARPESG